MHCFVNFYFWTVIESSMDEGGVMGWGRKTYAETAEIASFSSLDFSQSNKHDTF